MPGTHHQGEVPRAAIDLPDALRHVPGLDAEEGLRRVLHKAELYLGMVRRFANVQQKTPGAVRQAIDQGAWDDALRLVHTFKGLAGNIGAQALQLQAADLEPALQAQAWTASLDQALATWGLDTAQLVADLQSALPQAHEADDLPTDTILAEARAELSRLRELLDAADPDAVALFARHRAAFRALLPHDQFARLAAAIESFDFEDALQYLTVT